MQRSRLPLMLALITFGLALVSGAYLYNRTLRTVPALTVVKDVAAGAELSPDIVRLIRVPAGGLPTGALWGPGQVTGRYAAVPLLAEQILTFRHLAENAPGLDPLTTVGPGQRVISVPVKGEAVLGGALRPGDIVDVAAAWPGQAGEPGAVQILAGAVRLVDLRNAAGASTQGAEGAGPDGAVPTTALLLVNTQQAKALVGSVESQAAIYLWLVGREGS